MDSECLFGPNDIPPLPPPLLCNPLPLQCLAADALPATLQEEIGDMLDVYVNTTAIEPPPEFNDKKELTMMSTRPTEDAPPLQQAWSSDSLVSSPRHQMTFLLRRKQRSSYQGNDFGVGLRIVGGVNCEQCRNLHAVITSVLPGTECAQTVRQGMLVAEWCGKKLDGRSYEHVHWLMSTTEDEVVEIVVREPCVARPGSTTTFQLRMSGHSSSHSSLKGRLSVFLGTREVRPEEVDTSDTSNSSSRRESTTGTEEQLEGFFASLPSGMIKLSIQYSRIEERLGVGLVQVKAQALEGHNEAAIFISVQLIPDDRSQELKFTKLRGTPALFHILPTKLAEVALRVTLWESLDLKSAFRGEVLLRVLDKDIVSLNGDPSWYTICSPDPNLPHLEDPFDNSSTKSRHVAAVEGKKGPGTWYNGQRRTLKTLFKKVSEVRTEISPALERNTSLPTAKAPQPDGMKLVFATMMKRMKKKHNSDTQFQSKSQLQSHSQSSTSLTQLPAQSPVKAALSPQVQVQLNQSQSQFQSTHPASQTQLQLTQSHSQSESTKIQSQSISSTPPPPTPAVQSGNGGNEGEDEDDYENVTLEKLASIINTLRRELSQSEKELDQIEALDPPLPHDDDIHTVGIAREPMDPRIPRHQEGGSGTPCGPPLPESRGQPSPVVTDIVVGWNDPDVSACSGRSLASYQGNCDHEDIEVCLLDAKKWSDEDGFSPNLGQTNRGRTSVAMVLEGVNVDDDECRVSTSTPVTALLHRGECPGLPPMAASSPITALSPSPSETPSSSWTILPSSTPRIPPPPTPSPPSQCSSSIVSQSPSPNQRSPLSLSLLPLPPSPHSSSLVSPSPSPPSPRIKPSVPPSPSPPSPHTKPRVPPSPSPPSPQPTPHVPSSRAAALSGAHATPSPAAAEQSNVVRRAPGGSEGRTKRAARNENARPPHEAYHVTTDHSVKDPRLYVPSSDTRTTTSQSESSRSPSNNKGGTTSSTGVPNRSNVVQYRKDGLNVAGDEDGVPPALPPAGQTSAEQPSARCPTPSSRPVHFQSKHRSRSLNDILTSSGEESSVSAVSHGTVGVAPSRDVGVAATTAGHVADDDGSGRGSGSGALTKQSRKVISSKRHHARRSSLTAINPKSQDPPPPGDGATPTASQPWLMMAGGCVASAHSKGHPWYSSLFGRKKGRNEEERSGKPQGELQKSKSTENVLDHEQGPQKPHDQRRRGSHASIHPMAESKKAEDGGERALPLGSIQLSFSYSPQTPALQVTLTDMVMLSSKGLFSDFKLKMRVLHTSSGVCLMKHKTSLNYKRGVVNPNVEFQFFMEVQNLSLQVLISVPGTHMFSRKSYMEAWIDLNQLGLAENKTLSKWFEVQKKATI